MNKYIYIRFLTTLQLTTFENIIILTKQFLRLPKCFQFCLGIKPSAGYVLYMGALGIRANLQLFSNILFNQIKLFKLSILLCHLRSMVGN